MNAATSVMYQMLRAKPPPPFDVKHDTNLFVPVGFISSHFYTQELVIVEFRGRLLRQYRACVVDSLGLGITCLISLYYVYKAS